MNISMIFNSAFLSAVFEVLKAYTYEFKVYQYSVDDVTIEFGVDKPLNVVEFAKDIKGADFLRKYDSIDLNIHDSQKGYTQYFRLARYNAYHDDITTLIDLEDF